MYDEGVKIKKIELLKVLNFTGNAKEMTLKIVI
jgi:hypothetical protein